VTGIKGLELLLPHVQCNRDSRNVGDLFCFAKRFSWHQSVAAHHEGTAISFYRGADKSLARPD